VVLERNIVIEASLSEPHIDEFAVEFLYIYICISRTSCRKSLPALILRVLASFVNSKTVDQLLIEKTRTAVPPWWQQQWPETTRGPTYSM